MNNNQTQGQTAQEQTGVHPYPVMVENLFKNMDTDAGTLMHAAAGAAGEAGELLEGLRNVDEEFTSLGNVTEELGDIRFYLQKIWNIYGWEWDSFVLPLPDLQNLSVFRTVERIVIECSAILDIAKKQWVYGKDVDVVALHLHTERMLTAYRDLILFYGWSDGHIQRVNREKLAKRYPAGVYTNEAAIARADKAPSDEATNLHIG